MGNRISTQIASENFLIDGESYRYLIRSNTNTAFNHTTGYGIRKGWFEWLHALRKNKLSEEEHLAVIVMAAMELHLKLHVRGVAKRKHML